MIVGILLAILGLLAIITGPACTCSKAVDNFKRVENTNQEYKCSQCSWLWLKCSAFGQDIQCSRGCVIIAVNANGGTPYSRSIILTINQDPVQALLTKKGRFRQIPAATTPFASLKRMISLKSTSTTLFPLFKLLAPQLAA